MQHSRSRQGFTLTEMLIVIAIILIITLASAPSIFTALRDRKFSESSRIIQAALVASRDRAISTGQTQGIRLLRDEADPWSVTRFEYIAVSEPLSQGLVSHTTAAPGVITEASPLPAIQPIWVDLGEDTTPNSADDIFRVFNAIREPGPDQTIGNADDTFLPRSYIRFGGTGRFYGILQIVWDGSAAYQLDLNLPNQPLPPFQTFVSHEIYNDPIPLPGVDAPPLPEGIVIDVRSSPIPLNHPLEPNTAVNVPRSRGIPNQLPPANLATLTPDNWPAMDILFDPSGQIVGRGGLVPFIHLWVGEQGDKGPLPAASLGSDGLAGTLDDIGPQRPRFMITIRTRTGLVETFENPGTAGTLVQNYSEIYLPAEERLGVSGLHVAK